MGVAMVLPRRFQMMANVHLSDIALVHQPQSLLTHAAIHVGMKSQKNSVLVVARNLESALMIPHKSYFVDMTTAHQAGLCKLQDRKSVV